MKTRASFRELFKTHHPLVSPVAHDALSARLITAAGFPAVSIGGLSMLASQFGLPDLGIATLGEMLEGARCVMRGTHLPCAIDGDDGYGDLKSVARTVEVFEEIGIGSIVFEDQSRAHKHPGDGHSSHVVSIGEMRAKLRTAMAARRDPETIILARTDAYPVEGLNGAMRRAGRYLEAGADGIFISSLKTVEELERAGAAFKGTIQVAVVTERLLDVWPSPAELHGLGYSQVVFQHLLLSHSVAGMQTALADIRALARGERSMSEINRVPNLLSALQEVLGRDEWIAVEEGGRRAGVRGSGTSRSATPRRWGR
jgi:2-methylisocitrate lyase-like PEP mutase family enzyme